VAADFFTTEVWTARGLVSYYVAFLLDVQSRRIQLLGCTPHPNEAFVIRCLRHATGDTGLLAEGRPFLCDRGPKWSSAVEQCWVRLVCTWCGRRPARRTCNAYAERFAGRSRKNASIASFRSANGTYAEHCRSSRCTIIASGITRVSRTS
jgi:hypothetical protein